MKYVLLYILGIVACNVAFDILPLVQLGELGAWPPASLIVGLGFVLRDYAQREVGHRVIFAMLIGAALSYLLASPFVAFASLAAFLASEIIDWLVFTFSGKPFAQRILLSSAISTPVDSAVFLALIGHFSVTAVILMTASKMVGAALVWKLEARRIA
jgi:uncharacterized PurR-regulated membrane protein YhhQ (DUF165 family)